MAFRGLAGHDVAIEVAADAVQLPGGHGHVSDCPVARMTSEVVFWCLGWRLADARRDREPQGCADCDEAAGDAGGASRAAGRQHLVECGQCAGR